MSSQETLPASAGQQAGVPAGGDVRTGAILTDRPCVACGFNLHGQPIVRERHYGLIISRCPECGVVAALQEYPTLGRWAGRWAGVLAALWFAALLAGLFATGGLMMALGNSIRVQAVVPLAVQIATEHRAAQTAALAAAGGAGSNAGNTTLAWYASQEPTSWASIEVAWWTKQDPAAVIDRARASERGVIDWWALWGWRALPLVFLPIGMAWGTALVAVKRSRVWLVAPVAGVLAGGLHVLAKGADGAGAWVVQSTAQAIAASIAGGPVLWLTIGASVIPVAVGAVVGRPLTRWAARLLLPPRARTALGILWTCDGLSPPRP